MFSTLKYTFVFATALFLVAGCEITPPDLSGVVRPAGENSPQGGIDDSDNGSTDTTGSVPSQNAGASSQPVVTAAPECSASLDVTFNVQIHTLFVNNSLLIDGLFDWRADGAGGQLVDLEFKTNATQWTTIAADLPSADVKTIDLSSYAGPSSSWHFRAATWHPACPQNLSYSAITTIQN
ncbi:MAG: hypothetical protein ACI9OJ_003594 [Myxococcota bacterium]|jgi:hypothetical protein